MSKSSASVDLGNMSSMAILVYISRALITAGFREISSDEFKDRYLALLDNAIKVSSIKRRPLLDEYAYPLGDPMNVEQAIQEYLMK